MKNQVLQQAFNFIPENKGKYFEPYLYNRMYSLTVDLMNKFIPIITHELDLRNTSIIYHLVTEVGYRKSPKDTPSHLYGGCYTITRNQIESIFSIEIYFGTILVAAHKASPILLQSKIIETLAHELRHTYQKVYKTHLYTDDKPYLELDNEIDARFYAQDFIDRYRKVLTDYIKLYHSDVYEVSKYEIIAKMDNLKLKGLNWSE